MTSRGLELRAVLEKRSVAASVLVIAWECPSDSGMDVSRGSGVPCVRDDDVVEWGVALAEASETNLDNHFR